MKILNIQPKKLNNDLVKLICSNKKLKKKYIKKHSHFFYKKLSIYNKKKRYSLKKGGANRNSESVVLSTDGKYLSIGDRINKMDFSTKMVRNVDDNCIFKKITNEDGTIEFYKGDKKLYVQSGIRDKGSLIGMTVYIGTRDNVNKQKWRIDRNKIILDKYYLGTQTLNTEPTTLAATKEDVRNVWRIISTISVKKIEQPLQPLQLIHIPDNAKINLRDVVQVVKGETDIYMAKDDINKNEM